MVVKIIWILIGLNAISLVGFIGWFLMSSVGRNVDTMENGWMLILFGVGVALILLAAVPLRLSQTTFSISVSMFFAGLPLATLLCVWISRSLPSLKADKSLAKTYYEDKMQQMIASSIEQNDTLLLSRLIEGQDVNIRGKRVWDQEGINYLHFAIRVRSMADVVPVNIAANTAAIHLLIEKGSDTTPALCDAVRYVSLETLALMLDAGADVNRRSDVTDGPLLFDVIGTDKQQNDKAILLIRKGADVNAKNGYGLTPVMFAANNAQTSESWNDVWRVVRYLLEDANCNYRYTTADENSLQKIVSKIKVDADAQGKIMPANFIAILEWLKQQGVDPALSVRDR